jgi:hypothetical protein
MKEKFLRGFGIVGLALLVSGYFFITIPHERARKDALTFSNTSAWEPYYLSFANGSTTFPEAIFKDILLVPPPKNSSDEVAQEIQILKSYRALRTPQELLDFVAEGEKETLYIGGYTFAEYTDPKIFPATAPLLEDSFHDTAVIEMRQKMIFDRVRPSFLDPSLDTMTPIHGHPAYPSYRSAEMHVVAYILGELAPARRDEFIARADQIAFNCQIAGLQYPSDTRAGVILAKQIFGAFMKNEKFQTLLAAAKREWEAKGLTLVRKVQ